MQLMLKAAPFAPDYRRDLGGVQHLRRKLQGICKAGPVGVHAQRSTI